MSVFSFQKIITIKNHITVRCGVEKTTKKNTHTYTHTQIKQKYKKKKQKQNKFKKNIGNKGNENIKEIREGLLMSLPFFGSKLDL